MDTLRRSGVTLVTDAAAPDGAIVFEPWEPAPAPFAVPDGVEVHHVGDCAHAGMLDAAFLDASRVGRAL
jgi:hypothetical protein